MKLLHLAFAVALVCTFVWPSVTLGRTITVPDDFLSIQDAVYDANTGDTVFIREGLYYETSISISPIGSKPPERKAITIVGEGMGKTIIDGSKGSFDVFIVNAPYTIIRDLTVRNSKASGICFRGKGDVSIVVNCESVGNRTGIQCQITRYDQNLDTDISKAIIIDNRIVDNRYYGLYLENGCQATVMHNWIEGNGYAGVYCRMDAVLTPCEPIVRNNHIINNASGSEVYGVVVAGMAQPTIRNNVIVGFPTGAYWYEGSHVDWFRNNVIMECGVGAESKVRKRIDYCLFYDNEKDVSNLQLGANVITGEDPLFVDPENGDYHLAAGSPCIGAGDPEMPDGTSETNYDGSDIDMGVYGGKEVGPACRIVLSKPSKDRHGVKTYYIAEDYEDLNGNGRWDLGEPFEDANDSGKWDEGETFTDENHNGVWDEGEPYIDVNYNGRYDNGEPFTDLNENGRWDDQREPYTDSNRNDRYDRGDEFTYIGLYTNFGYEAGGTDLFLAFLLEDGSYYTYNAGGAWVPGAYGLLNPAPFVNDNYAFAIHTLTLRFFYGFSLVDQNIGLFAVMAPEGHVVDQPWDALAGETVKFTEPQ